MKQQILALAEMIYSEVLAKAKRKNKFVFLQMNLEAIQNLETIQNPEAIQNTIE